MGGTDTSEQLTERKQRGYGDGSIEVKETKDGRRRYMARIRLPGARRRTVGTYNSEREAIRSLQRAQGEARSGTLGMRSRIGVESYLNDWLDQKRRDGRAYNTIRNYRKALDRAIEAFGRLRLDAVDKDTIQRLINSVHDEAGARTAEQTRTILHGAFEDAVDDELIGKNPVKRAKAPKVMTHEKTIFTGDQAYKLFADTKGDWYHALYVVSAFTGLRLGEALGLTWSDVELDKQTLRLRRQQQRQTGQGFVVKDLKTTKSNRVLPLVDIAVQSLREHKVLQSQRRKALGLEWVETGRVFTSDFGTPLDPANVRRRFYRDLKRLRLPRITPHELRHSANSIMASYGVPTFVRQAILGHAHASTTEDIYTHIGSGDLDAAREIMNRAIAELAKRSI